MDEEHSEGKKQIGLTVICAVSLGAGVILEHLFSVPAFFSIIFFVISYISGGYSGFIASMEDLRELEINIDFLMIAAAVGAAFIGRWIEGATLLFLFSLSGALETFALGKSRRAIHSLLKLRPSQGLLKQPNGENKLVPIEQLKVGQVVIVKPGEHIPIDGIIRKGQTSVNEAAITGESIPVSKETGDTVFAATLNENGVIEVEITKEAKDTTVAKIIQLVEEAQKTKAKTQRFLDTFEPRYAVSIVIFVILLILVPWLVFGQDFSPTFYKAMTVLVVASPCALIISTPASIISAIANGAKNGILFKGGVHIEQTVGINLIAFDKTGTLTSGKPEVIDMLAYDYEKKMFTSDMDKISSMMAIAAGCENHSEHHLAEAIKKKTEVLDIEPYEVEDMQANPGMGVEAKWNGEKVSVGNTKMFESILAEWSSLITDKATELKNAGKTVVFVVVGHEPVGLIALADQPREEAKSSIRQLRSMGIKTIAMLTGDNAGVAETIADELEISDVYAELLPEEKVETLKKLKEMGMVAMVGDGVNDAPALAVSDLGIAMGAAGTDVALETADVVLMGDDLSKLPYLLWLSRKAKRVVWQNITFALVVIVMLLFGVFFIDLPLTLGVVGHEGSTLLVVLNGLRLLKSG